LQGAVALAGGANPLPHPVAVTNYANCLPALQVVIDWCDSQLLPTQTSRNRAQPAGGSGDRDAVLTGEQPEDEIPQDLPRRNGPIPPDRFRYRRVLLNCTFTRLEWKLLNALWEPARGRFRPSTPLTPLLQALYRTDSTSKIDPLKGVIKRGNKHFERECLGRRFAVKNEFVIFEPHPKS
jgi:hypothetical protein